MSDEQSLQPVMVACHDCDLLNQVPELAPGESAFCIRCEAMLSSNPKDSIERSLALTWAAVVLFIIANIFPFLSFGMEGIVSHTTLASGVESLYQSGMVFLAAAVAFTTIIVPAMLLSGLLYLLWPMYMHRKLPGTESVFRWMQALKEWNMVEIFMIGIVVAGVKLYKMAALIPGVSIWAYAILIFVFGWIYVCIEPRVIWERLERTR